MNRQREQHATCGAVKIYVQGQKKVLSSSAPTASEFERKPYTKPLTFSTTLHVRPKASIEDISAPAQPNDTATTPTTE